MTVRPSEFQFALKQGKRQRLAFVLYGLLFLFSCAVVVVSLTNSFKDILWLGISIAFFSLILIGFYIPNDFRKKTVRFILLSHYQEPKINRKGIICETVASNSTLLENETKGKSLKSFKYKKNRVFIEEFGINKLYVYLDFPFEYQSRLTLISKTDYELYCYNKTKAKEIESSNPAFNEKFHVFATDELEAKQLLTPDFTNKIIAYCNYVGKEINFSIFDYHLHMTIYDFPKLFRPSILLKKTLKEKLQNDLDQFHKIPEVIDYMELGNGEV